MSNSIISAIMMAGEGFTFDSICAWQQAQIETKEVDTAVQNIKKSYPGINDDLLNALCTAYRDAAYKAGFKVAVKMMAECMQ